MGTLPLPLRRRAADNALGDAAAAGQRLQNYTLVG